MNHIERRYQGHLRSRLSETRAISGTDVNYGGARNLVDLVDFLEKQARRPAKSDLVIGLETGFPEEDLVKMHDSLYENNNPLSDRLIVGAPQPVIIIKPVK